MNILKKIICAALALLALGAFVACDKEEDTQTEASGTKSDKTSGVSYYAEYKGVKIEMGAEADAIITALGEYQDRKEIGDCGGLGAQVKYSYPSVEVYVLESKDDGNIIDQISFRDDIISTPEGVYIGMSVADAKKALGTPTAETDKSFEYAGDKYVLVITVADGKVNKIDYLNV